MRIYIKNGSIIDPAARVATIGSILIEDSRVVRVFDHAALSMAEAEPQGDDILVINAHGAVIAPGFIDLHSHLREPGYEHQETISSGTRAAAAGGFTTVCAMPDTHPAQDTAATVRQVREIARRRSVVKVEPIGALTIDRAGQTLSEMAELVEAGCVGFSDAPASIADASIMRNALAYAAMLERPIMVHCEDTRLTKGWAMNEGAVSMRLGLPGSPAAAEEAIIARDIALTELCAAHLHICSVSTAAGVAMIRAARQRGLNITAGVTAHHLTLNDRWVLGAMGGTMPPPPPAPRRERRGRRSETGLGLASWLDPALLPPFDPATRVHPPLRSDEDSEALIEGLRDGTIDAIVSGHMPRSVIEKDCEYRVAEPGISAFETALGLALTLVHRGKIDLVDLVAKLNEGPAKVLGRSPATLQPGHFADIVIFDPEAKWTVDPAHFLSKSHSNPVAGQQLRGRVQMTMFRGEIVFRRDGFGESAHSPNASRIEGILEE